jgi:hypothetical protein
MLFGAAYIAAWRDKRQNRLLLVYGTVLKYWAFAISLFGFLRSTLSLQVLLLFGVRNLIFAELFTTRLSCRASTTDLATLRKVLISRMSQCQQL